MTSNITRALLATLGTLALATGAHAADQSAHTHKADQLRPYQKPGIPLTLLHGDAPKVAPGATAQTTLTLVSPTDASVWITLSSKTGLDILGASTRTLTLAADTPRTLTLDVRGATAGRHYLDVVASLEGVAGTRAISVPVQVGAGGVIGKSTPGTMAKAADGTSMVVMPAVETIDGVAVIRDPSDQPR